MEGLAKMKVIRICFWLYTGKDEKFLMLLVGDFPQWPNLSLSHATVVLMPVLFYSACTVCVLPLVLCAHTRGTGCSSSEELEA